MRTGFPLKKRKKMRDAIKMMESKMTPESVARSRMMAEQEILTIKLGQLREKLGVKQDEFDNFSQTSISRLEKRKDIRVSTLIEYLNNLGMGLEIKTFPKKSVKKIKEEVLLRI
jgi:hypothetical protein